MTPQVPVPTFSALWPLLAVTSELKPPAPSYVVPSPVFAFPNVADWLLSCVKLHLWFYNFILKCLHFDWLSWMQATTKLIWPKLHNPWTMLVDTFDKDNPMAPHRRVRSTPNSAPSSTQLKLLCALNILAAASTTGGVFQLASESKFHHDIRKYRGMQGMLNTNSLKETDL